MMQRDARSRFGRRACLALVLCFAGGGFAAAFEPHLFVVTRGRIGAEAPAASLELEPPFAATSNRAAVANNGVARHFFGRHWIVSFVMQRVDVLDADSFERQLSIPVDGTPDDVLVVDETSAWISRTDRASLLEIDPRTGETLGELDLSEFVDGDGNADLRRLARDGDRMFVQAQRFDRSGPVPSADSVLIVIDLPTRSVLDVDPVLPGNQGIALQGSLPKWDMQVFPQERRLFVSATGDRLDNEGGIEEIDLDSLSSLGFVLTEDDVGGADLGGFVMETIDTGFAIFHTDIIPSSHLFRFTRADGPITGEIHLTFDFVDELAFDPVTQRLYVLDPAAPIPGIAVVDATTNELITMDPVPTGGAPSDLLVARGPFPGEARDLRVSRDAATGLLGLTYTPACEATDHDVVVTDLGALRARDWTARECAIGTSGSLEAWEPGEGSWAFVVTGTDAATYEGSYGRDSAGSERADDRTEHGCPRMQDLPRSCD